MFEELLIIEFLDWFDICHDEGFLFWRYCIKCGGKNCGGNFRLARRRAWVASGFMAWVTESARSSSIVLHYLVLCAGSLVRAVRRGGIGFLVQLRVHVTMGSYSLALLMFRIVMVFGLALCTLGDGVYITGTLGYGGMSASVRSGGVDSIINTLGDVYVFTCASFCVKMWDCSVGAVLLADGACCLIKLSVAAASCLMSLIEFSPFPFDIPLANCLRLRMALTTQSACVIVWFVIFLGWMTTVYDTCSELVFLTLHTWVR